LVLLVMGAILLLALWAAMGGFPLLALASFALVVVVSPNLLEKVWDWFSGWNLLLYSVFLALFMRCLYIDFDLPNSVLINEVFLLNKGKDFLLVPMALLVGSLAVSTCCYVWFKPEPVLQSLKVWRSDAWSDSRYRLVVLSCLGLSWLGIWLYLRSSVGDLSLANLSAPRGVSATLEGINTNNYTTELIMLATIACYITMIKILEERKLVHFIFFVLSFLTSALYFIIASRRSSLGILMINIIVLIYYHNRMRFNYYVTVVTGTVIIVAFNMMTFLRVSAFSGADTDYALIVRNFELPELSTLFAPFILTTNLIDVSKTAHIMAAVPEKLPYSYGATFMEPLFAWIPRSVWPSKPAFIDNEIGRVVFGSDLYNAGAVPPGIVAEMYWNLGYFGIFLGAVGVGLLAKWIKVNFANREQNNICLLYVTSFMTLIYSFMGSAFGSVFIGFLVTVLPMFLILNWLTLGSRHAEFRGSGDN